jgi:hypothetical protein
MQRVTSTRSGEPLSLDGDLTAVRDADLVLERGASSVVATCPLGGVCRGAIYLCPGALYFCPCLGGICRNSSLTALPLNESLCF